MVLYACLVFKVGAAGGSAFWAAGVVALLLSAGGTGDGERLVAPLVAVSDITISKTKL
jgi:hypothetical protein